MVDFGDSEAVAGEVEVCRIRHVYFWFTCISGRSLVRMPEKTRQTIDPMSTRGIHKKMNAIALREAIFILSLTVRNPRERLRDPRDYALQTLTSSALEVDRLDVAGSSVAVKNCRLHSGNELAEHPSAFQKDSRPRATPQDSRDVRCIPFACDHRNSRIACHAVQEFRPIGSYLLPFGFVRFTMIGRQRASHRLCACGRDNGDPLSRTLWFVAA